MTLKEKIEKRVIEEAKYYVEHESTIRDTAKKFNYSKSAIHTHLNNKLETIDVALYDEYKKVRDKNIKERHIRGGHATKSMYMNKC